jgi:hypothetical protein
MVVANDQTDDIRRQPARELRIASFGIRPAFSFAEQAERIKKWRCGYICTEDGRLSKIVGRWWPYQGNWLQMLWDVRQRPLKQNRCELYYSQPWSSPGFLTLSYVRSGPQTSLSTLYVAALALDQIAKLKGCHAIVCHATNDRISDRFLARWGWQQHCPDWPGRHFIKRFYGEYPEIHAYWRSRLQM